jgi:hypothetical protein
MKMNICHRDTKNCLDLGEAMREAPTPEWIVDMRRHFIETGSYRTSDLRRLLGNPTKRIDTRPEDAMAFFCQQR